MEVGDRPDQGRYAREQMHSIAYTELTEAQIREKLGESVIRRAEACVLETTGVKQERLWKIATAQFRTVDC